MMFLKLKEITVFHILSLIGEGKMRFLKILQLLGKDDQKEVVSKQGLKRIN